MSNGSSRAKRARGGLGQMRSLLATIASLLTISSFILGWVKVNDIGSFKDASDWFHTVSKKYADCGTVAFWSCDNPLPGMPPPVSSNLPGGIDPNTPKDQVKAQAAKAQQESLAALATIPVKEAQKVPYQRSEWKHWIGAPCDTRKKVLIAQGKDVKSTQTATSCKIDSGTWVSPYDNKEFTAPNDLDIDHVIPLGYAASHGGQAWDTAKKQLFANDLTQLLAVSATENRSKSDKGPGEYMPAEKDFQCQYSKIWVTTAKKYGVFLGAADVAALKNGLSTCV